jgi:excisionase family DNA binding protein
MPDMDTYLGDVSGTTDADPLLSVGEAAKLIGYSVSTLQRWDREGILTAERSPTNQRRYRRSALLAAMNRGAAA